MAKDLIIANKPVRKALAKKRTTTTTNIAKTISKIALIWQKLTLKPRPKAKKILQQDLVIIPEGVRSTGVAIAKTANCTINLL